MLELPAAARGLLQTISEKNGGAWIVGGAVRDLLMGEDPGDWDVAVNLTPGEILELFPAGRLIGGVCGTVLVNHQGVDFEITPCRTEGKYADRRHPAEVQFGPTILEDLARRDFTVNAMAFDGSVLLDPFGGQRDILLGVIRCVGDAKERFREDALRILRMLRFSAVLNFAVEKKTREAALLEMESVALLPRERVRAEMERILAGRKPQVLELLVQGGGLRRYGFYYAPKLARLELVPPVKLCRWWAFATQCGVDIGRLGDSFDFSRGFRQRLGTCTRLYRMGPAKDALACKKKLRDVTVDYASVSETFAALSPAFMGEPKMFKGIQLRGEPYKVEHLAVGGGDLAALGIKGADCGMVLESLLDSVIQTPALNNREKLLVMARAIAGTGKERDTV